MFKPSPPSLSSLDIYNQGTFHRITPFQDVGVELSKLEFIKFDGNIVNWRGIWDQFLIAIHENDSLEDIEKFTYFI